MVGLRKRAKGLLPALAACLLAAVAARAQDQAVTTSSAPVQNQVPDQPAPEEPAAKPFPEPLPVPPAPEAAPKPFPEPLPVAPAPEAAPEVYRAPVWPDPVLTPVLQPIPSSATAQGVDDTWAGYSQLIANKLVGIVIVKDKDHVAKEGVVNVKGVLAKEVPFIDNAEMKKTLGAYVGSPLTQASLSKIIGAILAYYRSHGRKFVDVSSPPQDITNGILQVLVIEGKVGNVKVLGSRFFDASSLAKRIRSKPGTVLDAEAIQQDLDWLNRNPFRQVDLVYVKGTNFGSADILLRTTDKFPLRFYASVDDSGTKLTQNQRISAGLTWGNILGDGQLDYQFLTSPNLKSFRAHSGSFMYPLPWRHIFTVFGSYADTKANLPDPLALSGYNSQVSARYEIPLKPSGSYKHSVTAGFDYKKYNNNLTFGGVSVFASVTDVAQGVLSYNGTLRDDYGNTSFRASAMLSPGGLTANNTDAAFGTSRLGARAKYHYERLEVNRTTGLPLDLTLVNLLTLQGAAVNLLASEQIGFGGFDTIRGYDTRVYNSDSGVIFSTELRSPTAKVLSNMKDWEWTADTVQGLIFFDYGAGANHTRLSGERATTHLASVGPGLRYSASTHVSLRVDYGLQLLNEAEVSRPYSSRAHFGLVIRF